MNRVFHIVTRIEDNIREQLLLLENKLEKQSYQPYKIWILSKEAVAENGKMIPYSKKRFQELAAKEDVVGWLEAEENYAERTFAYVSEFLDQNAKIDLVYGDDRQAKDINETYRQHVHCKPDFSIPYLSNYNYIGDSGFVRASYLLENNELLEWNTIKNHYRIFFSFMGQEEKCAHRNKIFLQNNAYFLRKMPERLVEEEKILQDIYNSKNAVIKERGNRFVLEGCKKHKKVSIFFILHQIEKLAFTVNRFLTQTLDDDFEIIVLVRGNTKIKEQDQRVKICNCDLTDTDVQCFRKAVQMAKGEIFIFMQEEVYPGQSDWISRLVDSLEIYQAGAVSPLLLNEDLTIEDAGAIVDIFGVIAHAYQGMVFSRVRDIFYNQYCIREVSTVSDCIFAVKRQQYFAVGGLSEEIAEEHMFADFGFQIRDAGFHCIYTPYACMVCEEKKPKADYLEILRKWGSYLTKDVFFSPNMKNKYFNAHGSYKIYSKRKPADRKWKKSIAVLVGDLQQAEEIENLKQTIRDLSEDVYICILCYQKSGNCSDWINAHTDVIIDSSLRLGTKKNIAFLSKFDEIRMISKQYVALELHLHEKRECSSKRNIDLEQHLHETRDYFQVAVLDHLVYAPQIFEECIDVIIPVYNGFDYLEKLFDSISKTRMQYRLIIVNDCSTDPRIKPFLQKVVEKKKQSVYIEHTKNMGFVYSINDALSHIRGHVAIVNTDVEVSNEWLERLMTPIILQNDIATTTPFTNSGSICSFPGFDQNNTIFMGQEIEEIDRVFKNLVPVYEEVPTGVGFCMGMNKDAVDEIGFFDAQAFGKGYGEENDWCIRASKHGYQNVHINNLFVYHKHGGTFLSSEKQELLKQHLELLGKRHIYFHSEVARYIKRDPFEQFRLYAALKICMNIKGNTYVYLSFNWDGGAVSYLKQQKQNVINAGNKYFGLYYDETEKLFWIECIYRKYSYLIKKVTLQDAWRFLKEVHADAIIVNELISFPKPERFLKTLTEIRKRKNIELKALVHDFYCICPSYTLVDSQFVFCGLPRQEECQKCADKNMNFKDLPRDMARWRNVWGNFLKVCDEVVCFSNDSRNHLKRIYPDAKIVVRPHKVKELTKVKRKKRHGTCIHVGIIGAINEVKGIRMIKEMSAIVSKEKKNMQFIIIGYTSEDIRTDHTMVTGHYCREELPELMERYEIDLVLIPSVWPETFSYTTQEAMMMGMPVAVFQIGAPAERVRQYEKGLVIQKMDAKQAIHEIEAFIGKLRDE